MGNSQLVSILFAAVIFNLGTNCHEANATSRDEAMEKAARQIVATMKQERKPSLKIGKFSPSDDKPANGGPGLQLAMFNALEAAQAGIVQKNAAVVLIARFRVVGDDQDKQGKFIREKVTFELLTEDDDRIGGPIPTFFNRSQDIAITEGFTGALPLDEDTRAEHTAIRVGIEEPNVFVSGSLIKSSPNGKVAIEVATKSLADAKRDKVEAKPLRAKVEDGLAEVAIGIGQVYEVRVHNLSAEEIAVQLAVDGIDMFTFSDDREPGTNKPKFSHMIVGPRASATIPGWHKTIDPDRDDNFISFLVTKYGEGAASQLPLHSQGKLGVITVSISRSLLPGAVNARTTAETGFGPPVKQGQEAVERTIDPAHDYISVRYAR